MISVSMVSAIKVQFLKPFYEDDFVEKGMVAWLTDIEWYDRDHCYKLFFDFSGFEKENDKYFKETYYSNRFSSALAEVTGRSLFTAKETGNYRPKYSADFTISAYERNDEMFAEEIKAFLKELTSY